MEHTTMKAWILHGFNDIRLEEVPIPQLHDGWVLCRIEAFQPSVTEVQRIKGFGVEGLEKVKKRLEKNGPSQMFGHEFSGRVVELGPNVTKLSLGDRVALREVRGHCGRCEACRAGRFEDCTDRQWIGIDYPGAFAEYVAVPEEIVGKVPLTLTPSQACCIQPLTAVVSDVDNANIQTNDTVVILGAGVLGLSAIQLCHYKGAGTVIVSDINEANLATAKKLGADIVVNGREEDIVETVKKLTQGAGAEVVFECAGGNPAQGLAGGVTLGQAFEIVRKNGTIVQLAHVLPGHEVPFELKVLRKKGIRYLGHHSAQQKHFDYAVKMISAGRINVDITVTHRLEGIEALPEAFEITGSKGKFRAINPAQVTVWTSPDCEVH